jgi:two-component system sensor histidine kinase/response regulator
LFPETRIVEGRPARILCVDDDSDTLNLRKHLLESAHYSVTTVNSGAEALRILDEGAKFDLVMLDYVMPGMKGDELAQTIQKKYPDIRMIAISAVGQLPPKLLQAVDTQLQKGQDPEVVLTTIARVLGRPMRSAAIERPNKSRTVLCVEDEQLQLQLRKMLFESAGFVVLLAQSANTALELFRSRPIDAVVMDYWLSGTNGTAIAEEMKAIEPRIPIVMLSGFPSLPGEGAIVDAWLRKGHVEPEAILKEVVRLMEQHDDRKAARR